MRIDLDVRLCNIYNIVFIFPANFPLDVVQKLPKDIDTGIYYGWANVNNGDVHKIVMSIGWNPFYDNTEKSMVTWLHSVTSSLAAPNHLLIHLIFYIYSFEGNPHSPRVQRWFVRPAVESVHMWIFATGAEFRFAAIADSGHWKWHHTGKSTAGAAGLSGIEE